MKIVKFIEDVVYTFYRFAVEGVYIALNIVLFVVGTLLHGMGVFYREVLVPLTHQTYDFLNYTLHTLYEESLIFTASFCTKLSGLLIQLGLRCQELVEKHQRERRWL